MCTQRPAFQFLFGCWCCLLSTVAVAALPQDDAPATAGIGQPANGAAAVDSSLSDPGNAFEPVASYCCPTDCCDRQVWVGALFLSRSSAGSIPLVFGDPDSPKGTEVFGTDDLDFGFAWGPQVGMSFCLDPCNPQNRLGIEFFAIDGWTSTAEVAGNYSVQFPSFPYLPEPTQPGNPATGFGTALFHYDSNLYNTEINYYHRSSDISWLTTLAGFRWIEISEQFHTVFLTGNTSPNYTISTNNHLYGFQLGTMATLQYWGAWRFDGWLKAGIYDNVAGQDATEDFRSAGGTVTYVGARGSNAAFVGDLGISARRQLTDRLSLRLSYMALWIEGLALAPNQLDNVDPSSNFATLDHSGGTFFHGGFVGGEFAW